MIPHNQKITHKTRSQNLQNEPLFYNQEEEEKIIFKSNVWKWKIINLRVTNTLKNVIII